ncbi:ATP-dependent RNA helicase DBP9 [Escovopsis weberi]|uniref:ATP-dependent RNA helicase DBP9 n=1 Tax=Escovopsis weberi TaxID=150374 RepID=A0A0M8N6E9_ESCWE|nr:ATP-dependent RNA helicase DBP9 [Escovopsis weberi]
MKHLRHDGELRTARQQAHLKHVPEYLLPKDGQKALTADKVGFVSFRKHDGKRRDKRKGSGGGGRRVGKGGARKADPLKTFKARRKTGK